MKNSFFRNLYLNYGSTYLQALVYKDEESQHTIHFVYISNGNCLENWKDDETGTLIDILALGSEDQHSIQLAEQILKGHEVHTIILPTAGCVNKTSRRFQSKGVSKIVSGNGDLICGDWKFTYWSKNGILNIYHDRNLTNEKEELVMGKMAIAYQSSCSSCFKKDAEYCETDCLQWNDCDALNDNAGNFEDEICTGTLILGGGISGMDQESLAFIRRRKSRLRTIFLAKEEQNISQMSSFLGMFDDRKYRYYLGGDKNKELVADIILSSPYARYQSLCRYGVCINGCFLKENSEKDC